MWIDHAPLRQEPERDDVDLRDRRKVDLNNIRLPTTKQG
jgi:hypothetical protein